MTKLERETFKIIKAGGSHTVGITSKGRNFLWGCNGSGQCGIVGTKKVEKPTKMENFISKNDLILEYGVGSKHTIVLTEDGSVYSWGANEEGQCGIGKKSNIVKPTKISFLLSGEERITHVEAGGYHSMAVTSSGAVYSWGDNEFGQCGFPLKKQHILKPTKIENLESCLDEDEKITKIVAGSEHSLAMTSKGSVLGWGKNKFNQTGVSGKATVESPTKLAFENLLEEGETIEQLCAGSCHSLVLTSNHMIYCWGRDQNGQCGLGDNQLSIEQPTKLMYFEEYLDDGDYVTQISAGGQHTLAVTNNGDLYCWGWNSDKQCGPIRKSGLPAKRISIPTKLTFFEENLNGEEKVIHVEAGTDHSFALTSEGSLYSWGANSYGQCGLDMNQPNKIGEPTRLTYLDKYDNTTRVTPINVSENGITQLFAGCSHTFALSNNGTGYACGRLVGIITKPGKITYLDDKLNDDESIAQFSVGDDTCFARTTNGVIYSWGDNKFGQCGLGNITLNFNNPMRIFFFDDCLSNGEVIINIDSGHQHALALSNRGNLYSWGENREGQCGLSKNLDNMLIPAKIEINALLDDDEEIVQLAPGRNHNLVLTSKGSVLSWGSNEKCQCGVGKTKENIFKPVKLNQFWQDDESIVQLAAGRVHSMALMSNGTVYTWGSNDYGECGFLKKKLIVNPTCMTSFDKNETITSISAGDFYSVALTNTGIVYCWGKNGGGQCGLGDSLEKIKMPTAPDFKNLLHNDERIIQICAGDDHCLALSDKGAVCVWGENHLQQCGKGPHEIYHPILIPEFV